MFPTCVRRWHKPYASVIGRIQTFQQIVTLTWPSNDCFQNLDGSAPIPFIITYRFSYWDFTRDIIHTFIYDSRAVSLFWAKSLRSLRGAPIFVFLSQNVHFYSMHYRGYDEYLNPPVEQPVRYLWHRWSTDGFCASGVDLNGNGSDPLRSSAAEGMGNSGIGGWRGLRVYIFLVFVFSIMNVVSISRVASYNARLCVRPNHECKLSFLPRIVDSSQCTHSMVPWWSWCWKL